MCVPSPTRAWDSGHPKLTFLGAQPLEGVRLGEAGVGDDLGAQLDGQVDGAVALGQPPVVQEGEQLSQGHLSRQRLTWRRRRGGGEECMTATVHRPEGDVTQISATTRAKMTRTTSGKQFETADRFGRCWCWGALVFLMQFGSD